MKVSFHKDKPSLRGKYESYAPEEFVFEFRVSAEELKKVGPLTEEWVRKVVENNDDKESTESVIRFLQKVVLDGRDF